MIAQNGTNGNTRNAMADAMKLRAAIHAIEDVLSARKLGDGGALPTLRALASDLFVFPAAEPAPAVPAAAGNSIKFSPRTAQPIRLAMDLAKAADEAVLMQGEITGDDEEVLDGIAEQCSTAFREAWKLAGESVLTGEDSEEAGEPSAPTDAAPGEHVITVRIGHDTWKRLQSLALEAGKTVEQDLVECAESYAENAYFAEDLDDNGFIHPRIAAEAEEHAVRMAIAAAERQAAAAAAQKPADPARKAKSANSGKDA